MLLSPFWRELFQLCLNLHTGRDLYWKCVGRHSTVSPDVMRRGSLPPCLQICSSRRSDLGQRRYWGDENPCSASGWFAGLGHRCRWISGCSAFQPVSSVYHSENPRCRLGLATHSMHAVFRHPMQELISSIGFRWSEDARCDNARGVLLRAVAFAYIRPYVPLGC